MVPKCELCDHPVDLDVECIDTYYGDETVSLIYEGTCPCCGRVYRWEEPYVWTGDIIVTNISQPED